MPDNYDLQDVLYGVVQRTSSNKVFFYLKNCEVALRTKIASDLELPITTVHKIVNDMLEADVCDEVRIRNFSATDLRITEIRYRHLVKHNTVIVLRQTKEVQQLERMYKKNTYIS